MTTTIQPIQFPTRGLAYLVDSMERYLVQKIARELAEQRLTDAFGQPVQATGAELTMQSSQEMPRA